MPPDAPIVPPSPEDRRAYYRITVVLPISIRAETDATDVELIEKSVNISGGGIGVTVNVPYNPNDVLSLTVLLPDQVIFKAAIEVVRVDSVTTHHGHTYRLHARFVRVSTQDRELLIRSIMRFQRDRLSSHYLA